MTAKYTEDFDEASIQLVSCDTLTTYSFQIQEAEAEAQGSAALPLDAEMDEESVKF